MERFPCENQTDCPLKDTQRGCFEDIHHRIYPARLYKDTLGRIYRELPENKEISCRQRHNDIHAEVPSNPAVRPSKEQMLGAIALHVDGLQSPA